MLVFMPSHTSTKIVGGSVVQIWARMLPSSNGLGLALANRSPEAQFRTMWRFAKGSNQGKILHRPS